MIVLCLKVFQRGLIPSLNNLAIFVLGCWDFYFTVLTLKMLLRFMLLEDLKLCARVINSNANASNQKIKWNSFWGIQTCGKNSLNIDDCLGS